MPGSINGNRVVVLAVPKFHRYGIMEDFRVFHGIIVPDFCGIIPVFAVFFPSQTLFVISHDKINIIEKLFEKAPQETRRAQSQEMVTVLVAGSRETVR